MNIDNLYTFGKYTKDKFGQKVAKIPVSLSGFTCPNIDGTKARGGCSFCENESFSPNLAKSKERSPTLHTQLVELSTQYKRSRIKLKRHGYKKFIIYFQSFTNTYAPLETLKALYEKALRLPDVVGISIGTRTDSVSDEILNYLKQLSIHHEIWIEFGVQSIYDETLIRINRAEKSEEVLATIQKSVDMGLNVCTHFIFGLPDESEAMMLKTVQKTVALGVQSIKIHPLYIVKNTALANDYYSGKFNPISLATYKKTLTLALASLDDKIIVQRITAGVEDETLIAPVWCANKNRLLKGLRG